MVAALKYLLWALSTATAFLGTWLFAFSQPDPVDPSKRRITRIGKIALPFVILSFALSLSIEISENADKAAETRQLIAERDRMGTELTAANQKLERLAFPLRPVFINYNVTYTKFSETCPKYSKRVALAMLSKPIFPRLFTTFRTDRVEDHLIFPTNADDCQELLEVFDNVALKVVNKGSVTFEVQPIKLIDWKQMTGWPSRIMLDFHKRNGGMSVTRYVQAPAVVFANPGGITSTHEFLDSAMALEINITVHHPFGLAQDAIVGNLISITLPDNERVIRTRTSDCRRIDEGNNTTLLCRPYQIVSYD